MRMGPVSFLVLLVVMPVTLRAQRQASLGVGTGIVRYAGGSSFSALTISPAAQRLSASTYLGVSGSASLLEGGVWAGQARADIWAALSQRTSGVRPAVSATISGSTRSDGAAAGSGAAVIEAVRGNVALGAGVVTGVIQQEPGVGALRLRGRAWWQLNATPAQLSLTTEATRFLGGWYTDAVGCDRGQLERLDALGLARPGRRHLGGGAAPRAGYLLLQPGSRWARMGCPRWRRHDFRRNGGTDCGLERAVT